MPMAQFGQFLPFDDHAGSRNAARKTDGHHLRLVLESRAHALVIKASLSALKNNSMARANRMVGQGTGNTAACKEY